MKMAYQGVALLLVAVIGIGFAAYQYYTQQNSPYTYGSDRSHTYSYQPSPEVPQECPRRRRRRINESCTICHDELTEDEARELPCTHSFHEKCIADWFKESNTCPICRREVRL